MLSGPVFQFFIFFFHYSIRSAGNHKINIHLITFTPPQIVKIYFSHISYRAKIHYPKSGMLHRTFGTTCFPWLRSYNRHKFNFHSSKYLFIGYSDAHKGYKCLHPSSRIYISRHVLFTEGKFPYQDLFHPKPPVHYPQSSSHLQPVTAPVSFSQLQLSVISAPLSHIAASTSSFYPMITRSKSGIYKPKSYLSSASSLPLSATTTIDTVVDVPASVQAVLADPKWNATMQSEFDALKRNKTGSLVPYSQDQTVIGCKWIFRVKYRADGTRNGNGSDWFRISMLQTRNPLWTGCSKPNPCRAKIFNCRSRPIRSEVIYTRP
ncbi:hypothetical protein ACOSQ4_004571 [Xanthoceras sorbifolium]